MRLHLNSALRRGLILAIVVLTIVTVSLHQRKPSKTSAARIKTPQIANDLLQFGTLAPSAAQERTVHFIFPATQINKLVCKALFSAGLNSYPPPVLLNFNSVFRDAEEARFMKIAAIHKYLTMKVHDEDLVLIMDSYDTWFQLSADTLIERYYKIQEHDRKLYYKKHTRHTKSTSGLDLAATDPSSSGITVSKSGASGADELIPDVSESKPTKKRAVDDNSISHDIEEIPPYAEHAIFGADKVCWPNKRTSAACSNVPNSTLPSGIYGPDTDTDVYEFKVRPRWLNSGNIIGPAKVLKEIYMRAFDVQQRSRIHFSDQLILADIYGKQDLPIRIDYESYLFQTMTHSHSDVMYLYEDLVEDDEDPDAEHIDPITGVSSKSGAGGSANSNDDVNKFENKKLIDDAFFTVKRRRISEKHLAWNRVSGVVPAVLHFNGPKLALETWWNKMWWVHDQSPVHRLQRLKHVRRTSGAFVDDDGTIFKSWKELCGKFDMFEYTPSPFDNVKLRPNAPPSLDPEPFRLGMNPHKSPSDVLRDLSKMREDERKREEDRKKKEDEKRKKEEQDRKLKAATANLKI
ncbi:hypothetical protein V1514DRAFT_329575 [Lipomyces japonicus]|uniref:uncharacterized protein n=1 Tax=Lipomyces japonicus TaxID=56871 RepID=UPI0034CE22EE